MTKKIGTNKKTPRAGFERSPAPRMTIAFQEELITFLADRIRNDPDRVVCLETIAEMFELQCANILRNDGYWLAESMIGGDLSETLQAIFEGSPAKRTISRSMVRFVGIAQQDYVARKHDSDFFEFERCVHWFLEALRWEKRSLVRKHVNNDAMLCETKWFRKRAGRAVQVPIEPGRGIIHYS